ncbi:hypothetical protein EBR96_03675 [bacterium]|nr:hypothetical protein [bacterium]
MTIGQKSYIFSTMKISPLLTLGGLIIAGIALNRGRAAGQLTINPLSVKVGRTPTGSNGLILTLEIFNPSSAVQTVTGVSGTLTYKGDAVGSLEFAGTQRIAANGYSTLPVFVRPNAISLIGNLLSIVSGNSASIRNQFSVSGRVFSGAISFPFNKTL